MTVSLVGAGPGDPGLITVRGLDAAAPLRGARLRPARRAASSSPRRLPRRCCISRERLGQAEINDLLVAHGRRGLEVVRLKGGDPFVFGRGGEEALALAEAGVPFEVVPGVSSLAAVPGVGGIPITHRGLASQVTLVSGHDPRARLPRARARAGNARRLHGPRQRRARSRSGLIAHGKDARTPAAVVSRGTLPDQRTAIAPLHDIARVARHLESPALLVVGETAGACGAPRLCKVRRVERVRPAQHRERLREPAL